MENLKVTVVGNSVGLRIRPPQKYPDNKNYGMLLEERLQVKYPEKVVLVNNLCVGRGTLWDVLDRMETILNSFPHYYVVNLGVTDASTREIPLWFSNIINRPKPSLIKSILRGLYVHVLVKVRPPLVLLRGETTWSPPRKFKKYFDKFIDYLITGTNARIIIISINRANKRIETELPGSSNNYVAYNEILKSIAHKYQASYLDTSDLEHKIHAPDGIHLSLEGHKVLAGKIFEIIARQESRAQ